MTVNVNKLKGKFAENGLTQEKVAQLIGVDNSTFIRKMKSQCLTFSIGQMHKMVELLHITPDEAINIFLCNDSH